MKVRAAAVAVNIDKDGGLQDTWLFHRCTVANFSTMIIDSVLLDRKLGTPLTGVLGQRLVAIFYQCLKDEHDDASINERSFYTGGALRLDFETTTICISWDENAGWPDHFSIETYIPESESSELYEEFYASGSPMWRAHVGQRLVCCSVLGWEGTPGAIGLTFATGVVFAAIGNQGHLRDRDDLYVRTGDDLWSMPSVAGIQLIWESFAAEAE